MEQLKNEKIVNLGLDFSKSTEMFNPFENIKEEDINEILTDLLNTEKIKIKDIIKTIKIKDRIKIKDGENYFLINKKELFKIIKRENLKLNSDSITNKISIIFFESSNSKNKNVVSYIKKMKSYSIKELFYFEDFREKLYKKIMKILSEENKKILLKIKNKSGWIVEEESIYF